MIHRNALKTLKKWSISPKRKPLVIRGARQVGKTTLVRMLSQDYANYLELNLEKSADRRLFETDDISQILKGAFLIKNILQQEGNTLLFIDEIQESPQALKLLRFFYEEYPEIHVIAAGSLLEFALAKVPSFPVGRVDYLYLHPINFEEYLRANNLNPASEALQRIPIPDYAHETLLRHFHDYALLGGMPEILSNYLENRNIVGLNNLYKKLWSAYKDDVEKYSSNRTETEIIRHVINSAPYEEDRIKFERFGNSNFRSREVGNALRALDKAKIIRLIYPTVSKQSPIVTDYKKRPRLQFLDTGMLNQILLLQKEFIGLGDLHDIYKGRIIQHLVYQELISINEDFDFVPNFWVREQKESNAEVDLVYPYGRLLIPLEIKSGKQGTLKSLHQFVERSDHSFAIRLYAGAFSVEQHQTPIARKPYTLMSIPYYLGTKIPEYVEYLVSEYGA